MESGKRCEPVPKEWLVPFCSLEKYIFSQGVTAGPRGSAASPSLWASAAVRNEPRRRRRWRWRFVFNALLSPRCLALAYLMREVFDISSCAGKNSKGKPPEARTTCRSGRVEPLGRNKEPESGGVLWSGCAVCCTAGDFLLKRLFAVLQ